MIKLIKPYNHKGNMVEAGTIIALPLDVEKALVENKNAEPFTPETNDAADPGSPSLGWKKDDLLAHAEKLGITDIKGSMTKEEILKRIEEHGQL